MKLLKPSTERLYESVLKHCKEESYTIKVFGDMITFVSLYSVLRDLTTEEALEELIKDSYDGDLEDHKYERAGCKVPELSSVDITKVEKITISKEARSVLAAYTRSLGLEGPPAICLWNILEALFKL